jgi:hypothetical protein
MAERSITTRGTTSATAKKGLEKSRPCLLANFRDLPFIRPKEVGPAGSRRHLCGFHARDGVVSARIWSPDKRRKKWKDCRRVVQRPMFRHTELRRAWAVDPRVQAPLPAGLAISSDSKSKGWELASKDRLQLPPIGGLGTLTWLRLYAVCAAHPDVRSSPACCWTLRWPEIAGRVEGRKLTEERYKTSGDQVCARPAKSAFHHSGPQTDLPQKTEIRVLPRVGFVESI